MELIFIGVFIGSIIFGGRAVKKPIGSSKRRNNIIVSMGFLVSMIIIVIIIGLRGLK